MLGCSYGDALVGRDRLDKKKNASAGERIRAGILLLRVATLCTGMFRSRGSMGDPVCLAV